MSRRDWTRKLVGIRGDLTDCHAGFGRTPDRSAQHDHLRYACRLTRHGEPVDSDNQAVEGQGFVSDM
jgi:hypothetical protein